MISSSTSQRQKTPTNPLLSSDTALAAPRTCPPEIQCILAWWLNPTLFPRTCRTCQHSDFPFYAHVRPIHQTRADPPFAFSVLRVGDSHPNAFLSHTKKPLSSKRSKIFLHISPKIKIKKTPKLGFHIVESETISINFNVIVTATHPLKKTNDEDEEDWSDLMEAIIARALEYTFKYWLKSFSRDQFKLQGRTAQLSNLGKILA